ncbi:MAG: GNAT family N-acetyltransferase, partial [Nitrosopumilaceae archaeon]|nr:GNAT family N-acetyltransferase [Nitrosopumilaceae archaeon]
DVSDFMMLFSDSRFKPDMLKIYPSLVLQNTPLYNDYLEEKYKPYSDEELVTVLTEIKKNVPRWVRIMRVQREISQEEIMAGQKLGNLRQIVHKNLQKQNLSCKCIRCREAGLSETAVTFEDLRLNRENYVSSGGSEVFLSFDDSDDKIYGFVRLRHPSNKAHRKEITDKTCIVRELHVYGKSLKIGTREKDSIQHSGLGKKLMGEAEKISKEEFSANMILVISAVGTREYYRKLGYSLLGPYMAKEL